ncbi:hypothetical protein L3Q82_013606, partial [Scortum barcoo]
MESPVGALSNVVPSPGTSKKAGWYSVLLFGPHVHTNNSKRPIPDQKAQGSDPLIHQGKLQHMAAELGSYKQAHASSPPLTLGNSRVVEGPAPLKELGSRAPGCAWRFGLSSSWDDCCPNDIASAPHGPMDPATRETAYASPNPRPGSRVGPNA